MKFVKAIDTVIPPKQVENSPLIHFYAAENVRIEPQKTKFVSLGLFVEDMPQDCVLQLSLVPNMVGLRPFIQPNGVELITRHDELVNNEIGIMIYNRSNSIPAVVDKDEIIVQGILLKRYTEDVSKKSTNKK
jgi:dUTPase